LDQLALLADRIVEASPTLTIAAADDPTTHFKAQVDDLTKWLDDLTSTLGTPSITCNRLDVRDHRAHGDAANASLLLLTKTPTICAGTTGHLVIRPSIVNLPAKNWETPKPAASGDERCQPITQLPVVFDRLQLFSH